MTQALPPITQNRKCPVLQIQMTAHITPTSATRHRPSSLYRTVERQWPTVPRVGDLVSLGGADQVVEVVTAVHFLTGKVVLHFQLEEAERDVLRELGFEPAREQ